MRRPPAYDRGRRRFAAVLGFIAASPAWAGVLLPTPRQSRGPFYPERIPLDADNDLVQVAGQPGLAKGEIVHLTGRVSDSAGAPLQGATVEIWQCNAYGRYHHSGDSGSAPIDPAFQSFGRTETGADGGYRFRTIRPVPYPGRTPHIHCLVRWRGRERLVTQMYVAGEPGNAEDFLYRRIASPELRERVTVAIRPDPAFDGQPHARFDLVVPV